MALLRLRAAGDGRPAGAGRVGPRGPGSGAMPGRRLLEADRPERVGGRCAVAILVEFDLPRDALVIVSGVRERGAKRGGVGVRAGCHERAHADPDRVVRRQPERIDGGLGSTGDLLQQRVVTVLGAGSATNGLGKLPVFSANATAWASSTSCFACAEPSPPYHVAWSRPCTDPAAARTSATSSKPARYTAVSPPAFATCCATAWSAAPKSVVFGA